MWCYNTRCIGLWLLYKSVLSSCPVIMPEDAPAVWERILERTCLWDYVNGDPLVFTYLWRCGNSIYLIPTLDSTGLARFYAVLSLVFNMYLQSLRSQLNLKPQHRRRRHIYVICAGTLLCFLLSFIFIFLCIFHFNMTSTDIVVRYLYYGSCYLVVYAVR